LSAAGRLLPASSWRAWALCLGYLAAVYAALPFARDAVIALREQGLLSALLTFLFFGSAVAIAHHVVFDVRLSDRVAFFALVLLAAAIGSLLLGLSVAEERIHFLEYGLLAVLARSAWAHHLRPGRAYAAAWLLSTAAGWGDEALQGLLPERVYDLRDVAVNSVAAFLALAVDEVLHDRLAWLGPRRERQANPGRR
jgi:hypothetical protein